MSVRQEDERKNNCPSRGLGLAAAAVGVGVGAALYYFFSKRTENPDAEGSTSEGWRCQQPQALNKSEDDYTTISEHSTSDTSILDFTFDLCNEGSVITIDDSEESASTINLSEYSTDNDAEVTPDLSDSDESLEDENTDDENDSSSSDESSSSTDSFEYTPSRNNSVQSLFNVNSSPNSDYWDVTNSSMGIPVSDNMSRSISPLSSLFPMFRPTINSQRKHRERSWSLEECAICFEIMLKDQELMALPCTHNFHVACIGPWLQEQQTCPMCRKAAE